MNKNERTVLTALSGGAWKTGEAIQKTITLASDKHIALGKLYTALRSLRIRGLIESDYSGEPEFYGMRLQHYHITEAGMRALLEPEKHWFQLFLERFGDRIKIVR
jgi:DNA-binding PadR family transcriptional regulator